MNTSISTPAGANATINLKSNKTSNQNCAFIDLIRGSRRELNSQAFSIELCFILPAEFERVKAAMSHVIVSGVKVFWAGFLLMFYEDLKGIPS